MIEENKANMPTLSTGKRLLIAIALNALIFIVEIIGGFLTNSLALISDAMHNLSDFFALILSYVASKVVLWKSNSQKSYGYVRIEIIVAFINSLILVIIAGYIIYEGIYRFFHPEPVVGIWMLVVAAIGFTANSIAALLLRKGAHYDLSVRSAYLHLFTDAAESLTVVVAGILIYWQGWYILDPIMSIAIGVFIIKGAWNIIVETVNILTEGTPVGIDLDEVAKYIKSFAGVENVHHIHIWSLSSQFRALSAHLVVRDCLISKGCEIAKHIESGLHEKYKINHPTLQLECEICQEQNTLVDINHKLPE